MFSDSRAGQIIVDTVYTGRKSPMNGINSIMLIVADILLLVIEYRRVITIASNTSPIMGALNIGAAIWSKASAIIEILRAEITRSFKELPLPTILGKFSNDNFYLINNLKIILNMYEQDWWNLLYSYCYIW
jgi:hypothetical protein